MLLSSGYSPCLLSTQSPSISLSTDIPKLRDFLTDIPKLRDHLDWLQAVRSRDPVLIRDAQLKIVKRLCIRKCGDSTTATSTDWRRHTTKKKDEEKAREKELNDLLKLAVKQPKVPPGVDPKSIVCEHFKVGQCEKGFKCTFSHDLNVQRKGEKIDICSDKRDDGPETMEDWDQETLEKVVESKSKEYNKNKPTEIVCKYFLEVVEKKQFWLVFLTTSQLFPNFLLDKSRSKRSRSS